MALHWAVPGTGSPVGSVCPRRSPRLRRRPGGRAPAWLGIGAWPEASGGGDGSRSLPAGASTKQPNKCLVVLEHSFCFFGNCDSSQRRWPSSARSAEPAATHCGSLPEGGLSLELQCLGPLRERQLLALGARKAFSPEQISPSPLTWGAQLRPAVWAQQIGL